LPSVYPTQTSPLGEVMQSAQMPFVPHAPLAFPATQVPLVLPAGMEQQPPLHGEPALHVWAHWEVRLQA
jgi:hypothetical protein